MHNITHLLWLGSVALLSIAMIMAIIAIFYYRSILLKAIIQEVISHLLMVFIALLALVKQQVVFIDVCLCFALIMFLGMVAYYQYLSNKETIDD